MPSLNHRLAALGIAVPVALTSLTACGSESGTAGPPKTGVVHASPSTSGSPATHVLKHLGGPAFLGLLRGASQKITTARFSLTTQAAGQSVPITGVIDLRGDNASARMTVDLSGMGTPSQMVMVDRVVYVEVPGSGGRYYKIDVADPNGPLASLGRAYDGIDPGSMMSAMSPRMFRSVTDHGVTTVRGQQVHHYSARMNLRAVRALHLSNTAALPRTAAYDVWLDGQGRLTRFGMRMGRTGAVSGTYSHYGMAVHIVPPPAARVVPLPGTSTVG
jgi:hypothetical protein